jgi:poly-gamma-glutamate capsule biosynthesis protein CapA/YwtB (metallophosphatase superfamily)
MLLLRRLLLLALLLTSACQSGSPTPSATATSPPVSENPAAFSPTPIATQSSPTPSTPSPTFPPLPKITSTLSSFAPMATPSETALPITTLLFTGVIVPARCVQAALDELGNPDYPYEEVREIISGADIAVGVFNATMSDRVERTGCMWTYQLVGGPENADALARAGFDVMSVATNHIKDCGLMKSWCDYAFFDTLENLRRVGILPVGAGANLEEALKPVVITANGIRFGFVSLGDSKMNPVVFAKEDHPGFALLEEGTMRAAVAAARQVSDVVIALPHWGSEDILLPNWNQLTQAAYSVAAGADLVVGNHTHVIQPVQEIDGVMVFYGLGNFVFDQGLRDHRQGLILLVRFEGIHFAGYELIPTHVDPDGRVHIANPEEAAEILTRFEEASQVLE